MKSELLNEMFIWMRLLIAWPQVLQTILPPIRHRTALQTNVVETRHVQRDARHPGLTFPSPVAPCPPAGRRLTPRALGSGSGELLTMSSFGISSDTPTVRGCSGLSPTSEGALVVRAVVLSPPKQRLPLRLFAQVLHFLPHNLEVIYSMKPRHPQTKQCFRLVY